MRKATGGPAFGKFVKVGEVAVQDEGLTIRDWFAGQFLSDVTVEGDVPAEEIAQHCYAMADAMLKERER